MIRASYCINVTSPELRELTNTYSYTNRLTTRPCDGVPSDTTRSTSAGDVHQAKPAVATRIDVRLATVVAESARGSRDAGGR